MTVALAEDVVTKLLAYFGTNMPAKLAALNAEYNDGVTLGDLSYYDAEQEELPTAASLFVLADSTDMRERGGGRAWITNRTAITLVVLVTDMNTSALRRKLYRYLRALVELLNTGESTPGFPYGVFAMAASFSPILRDGANPFFSDARLTFEAFRQEIF